jgi:hypothetical protein
LGQLDEYFRSTLNGIALELLAIAATYRAKNLETNISLLEYSRARALAKQVTSCFQLPLLQAFSLFRSFFILLWPGTNGLSPSPPSLVLVNPGSAHIHVPHPAHPVPVSVPLCSFPRTNGKRDSSPRYYPRQNTIVVALSSVSSAPSAPQRTFITSASQQAPVFALAPVFAPPRPADS